MLFPDSFGENCRSVAFTLLLWIGAKDPEVVECYIVGIECFDTLLHGGDSLESTESEGKQKQDALNKQMC